MSKLLFPIF